MLNQLHLLVGVDPHEGDVVKHPRPYQLSQPDRLRRQGAFVDVTLGVDLIIVKNFHVLRDGLHGIALLDRLSHLDPEPAESTPGDRHKHEQRPQAELKPAEARTRNSLVRGGGHGFDFSTGGRKNPPLLTGCSQITDRRGPICVAADVPLVAIVPESRGFATLTPGDS